jgi:hypothetical protein
MAREHTKWCNRCGRDRFDPEMHVQMARGLRRACALTFTVVNTTTGARRESDPSREPLGLQRTRANRAAFVHESRV